MLNRKVNIHSRGDDGKEYAARHVSESRGLVRPGTRPPQKILPELPPEPPNGVVDGAGCVHRYPDRGVHTHPTEWPALPGGQRRWYHGLWLILQCGGRAFFI